MEAQLKDEQLRALANEQNLRRRHQQEIADTHKFAGQKFAVEMLPVKDYLEMALLDQSGNFDALKMGVQMTLNELQKAFDATQIKEINPKAGDKLDPNIHQAMQAVLVSITQYRGWCDEEGLYPVRPCVAPGYGYGGTEGSLKASGE